jgi:hypothetical protein
LNAAAIAADAMSGRDVSGAEAASVVGGALLGLGAGRAGQKATDEAKRAIDKILNKPLHDLMGDAASRSLEKAIKGGPPASGGGCD